MANGTMIIDGIPVEFDGEKNLLDVIRKAGVDLPTFCYYSELSVYGACRMCMVEDKWGSMTAACSTPPRDGMEIKTNTPKLQKHRKMVLELLLANHCRDCTTCAKSGKCRLQELALRFGITRVRFENRNTVPKIDDSSPAIVRDKSKCILCGDCVRMCSEIQGIGVIDFNRRGCRMEVSTAFDEPIAATNCVNCGQCAAVCPTGAIIVKNDVQKVWDAIHDPETRVVAQIAPAVRVAIGEEFDLGTGLDVMGRMVAALRRIGFDEVFDTSTGADITTEEESRELLGRLESGAKLPLFTSCCPAWVRFAENEYPDLLGNVSTCRSPMEMFASVLKTHYRETDGGRFKRTFVVGVMPCTAKKFEAARGEFAAGGEPDVDCVITTQGVVQMIRETGIVFSEIEPEGLDTPFGLASGAGVIFGVTGGVTESVLRRLAGDKSNEMLKKISFSGIRGFAGVKQAEVEAGGRKIRVAVVSGLNNARKLIEKIRAGQAQYDFVEVMACPGGCIAGAGQPFGIERHRKMRSKGLYGSDRLSFVKRAEENPVILSLYSGLLKGRTHELLHVDYRAGKDDRV
jgi:NADH-quinone oxidoreductase subunit G